MSVGPGSNPSTTKKVFWFCFIAFLQQAQEVVKGFGHLDQGKGAVLGKHEHGSPRKGLGKSGRTGGAATRSEDGQLQLWSSC